MIDAIYKNDLSLFKKLVDNGSDVNFKDEKNHTVLYHTVDLAHTEIVEYLVKNKAIVDFDMLFLAVSTQKHSVLEVFIENGVDVNMVDEDGNNVLTKPVSDLFIKDTIEMLLDAGFDLYHKNNKGKNIMSVNNYFGVHDFFF